MDINLLYKAVTGAIGLEADANGLLSMNVDGQLLPCELDGKRMALPTQEVLKTADWDHVVGFHPLSENILRGESPILKKLRMLMNLRITYVASTLLSRLLEIGVDHDYHKKLSPTAAEFLSRIPNVDEKTYKALDKILDSLELVGERRLVSIYLKRGGVFKDEKFTRVAVTSFPITDQFEADGHEIFGVKMRGKDKESIKALFEYILPQADNLEVYSAGSNSSTAPYFHALCLAFIKVAKRLNSVVRIFKKHLENADQLHIDVDWEEMIGDLSIYRDLIPSLRGNEGEVELSATEANVVEQPKHGISRLAQQASTATSGTIGQTAPVAPATAPAPVASAPVASSTVAPAPETGRGRSWDEIVRSNQQVSHQFGGFAPMGGMVPFGGQPPKPGEYAGYNRGIPVNAPQQQFGFNQTFNQVMQPQFGQLQQPQAGIYQGGI